MRVLIVCSFNSGRIAPFILEQGEALKRAGVEIEYFKVEGKGIKGYLKNRRLLIDRIEDYKPDLIHAHYGLSGLLANLQRKIPVVTTYHGSDINDSKVFRFSRMSMMLSAYNIFVSEKITPKSRPHPNPLQMRGSKGNFKRALIPCGVDIELFKPIEKSEARKKLNLAPEKKIILFAGAFENKVKNGSLAQKAVSLIPDITLLELKGYSRQEVVLLMNAVDAVLMTSFSEGSPQFIKEAMACNCPIVSVSVGDVPEVINNIQGCYLTSYNTEEVSLKLQQVFELSSRTNGRERVIELGLDSETITKRILEVYERVYSQSFIVYN